MNKFKWYSPHITMIVSEWARSSGVLLAQTQFQGKGNPPTKTLRSRTDYWKIAVEFRIWHRFTVKLSHLFIGRFYLDHKIACTHPRAINCMNVFLNLVTQYAVSIHDIPSSYIWPSLMIILINLRIYIIIFIIIELRSLTRIIRAHILTIYMNITTSVRGRYSLMEVPTWRWFFFPLSSNLSSVCFVNFNNFSDICSTLFVFLFFNSITWTWIKHTCLWCWKFTVHLSNDEDSATTATIHVRTVFLLTKYVNMWNI